MQAHVRTKLWRSIVSLLVLLIASCDDQPGNPTPTVPTVPGRFALPVIDVSALPDSVRSRIESAQIAARNAPDDPANIGALGVQLYVHGFADAAAVCFARAAVLDAQEFRWTYYLALAHKKDNNLPEAVIAFERAIALDGSYASALIELGDLLLESDPQRSGDLYQRAAGANPDDPRAHFGLGQLDRQAGRHEHAEQQLRKAIKRQPNYAKAHYALAMVLLSAGQKDEAQKHLKLHATGGGPPLKIDPLHEALFREGRDVNILVRTAVAFMKQGRIDDARTVLEEAVQIDVSGTLARSNLGRVLIRQGNFAEAATHFREVLQVDPNHQRARSLLGYALAVQGRFDEAEPLLRKVLAAQPDDADTIERLAWLLVRTGRHQNAVRHLHHLIEIRPGRPTQHVDLAAAMVCAGQFDEAAAEFRRAQTLSAGSEQTLPRLVDRLVALRTDQQKLARDRAGTATPLAPSSFPALADALLREGLGAEASRALAYAVHVDPKLVAAHRKLAALARADGLGATAVEVLERGVAANPGQSDLSSDLAWMLATWPEDAVRDGARARKLADDLCTASGRMDPRHLLTLAAALAELGEFDSAQAIGEQARSLEPEPPLDAQLDAHLEQLRQRQPIRSGPP
ncbi:MAG: tetratricopeptide repeat protein [bacterium]|nr:tetratricopeptide repeat protein [bacterium]